MNFQKPLDDETSIKKNWKKHVCNSIVTVADVVVTA